MASWFDLKGTFQTIFKIGKSKTSIDANAPTALRTFYMPDSDVDLRSGGVGQVLTQTGANTIAWQTYPGGSATNLTTTSYNKSGVSIPKMSVVYIDGKQGNLPSIVLAQADDEFKSARTYGITQANISNMSSGIVVEMGALGNLDTDVAGWVEGDILYLSPTVAGGITNVKPFAPDQMVIIGILVRKHPTQGVIQVKVQNGYELDELHNVSIPTTPTNGQVLTYNSSTSLWYAATPGSGGGGGYTEIPNAGSLTGTYDGEVYCVGNVSLSSNTIVKGNLYIVGNITNPSGYNLSVDGDLIVEGSLDFTHSLSGQSGALTVQGNCNIGYEITSTNSGNFNVFEVFATSTAVYPLNTTYTTVLTILSNSPSFLADYLTGSLLTINSINFNLISSGLTSSPNFTVDSSIDPENFSVFTNGPTLQARGIVAGDSIQFTTGANAGQSGAILTISGNNLTFASGTFTNTPSFGDSLNILLNSGAFYQVTLKGTQAFGATDPLLDGLSGTIQYQNWKSLLFREYVTTNNEIFIGGNLICYRLDVSALQFVTDIRGKNVEIGGNLTLKSFQTDVAGYDYYDFIVLQGSQCLEANNLIVRGSLYNGAIFGRPKPTTSVTYAAKSSNVYVYGDCLLTTLNGFQIFSGFVDLSTTDLQNNNAASTQTGGYFFVGGDFVGTGINVSGGNIGFGVGAKASSSGSIVIQGNTTMSNSSNGQPVTTDYRVNLSGDPINFLDLSDIRVNGGQNFIIGEVGGAAGKFYCGGNVGGLDSFSISLYTIFCEAGQEGDLGKIFILGDCFCLISYKAGNSHISNVNASIGGGFGGYNVAIHGNTYNSVNIQAGDGTGTSIGGGNINNNCLYIRENCYGAVFIRSGASSSSIGGTINPLAFTFDGSYIDQINITSGNGVQGGDIGGNLFSTTQSPTVRAFTMLSGNGTTGPAGSIVTQTYTFNCSGSISIRIGTTATGTVQLNFTDQIFTITGSMRVSSIQLRNMSATTAGGNASAGINLVVNGNVDLRDGGSISMTGGNALTGSSCPAPKVRINGNLIASLSDTSNTGVIITGGTVTTGNASSGVVPAQCLYVVGDATVGRITVNGGNQTSASGAVGGSAGNISAGAIQVNGKLKSARITMTGGNLTSSGAVAGQSGGNGGTVVCGSLSVNLFTANGGTVNAAAATKGSAGGFTISNLLNPDSSYIGTLTANDSVGGGVASTNAVSNTLCGHVIIDAWTLPTRTTYTVKCVGVPTSLIVRSFTGKNKLANNANVETAANLAADSMYFSTGSTWRSVTNAAFV